MSVSNTNFLQPSGFRVIINRQRFPNLEYFVQSVSHPSVDVPSAAGSYSRISQLDQTGDKLEFGTVTLQIMLDEEMAAYNELYTWMKRLVEEKHVPAAEATRTQTLSSEHDITLLILNSSNNQQKRITYNSAFPISLGEIQLESTATEPTPISVPVTFRYTYFEIS